ncbi:hypothetical protein K435DRAFT_867822 [Dendrothele bispora CBS 962.96]|uniref:Uncharacterized protein n=1 Tax=Dendrothele bispora (strain CBS 962.96) TaxID=1314807 RepID=A0A4S8LD75_DENBC|nr:hypothetical protein K435DRAFT_867822 [Dendrothele bispora CBS 962.96]
MYNFEPGVSDNSFRNVSGFPQYTWNTLWNRRRWMKCYVEDNINPEAEWTLELVTVASLCDVATWVHLLFFPLLFSFYPFLARSWTNLKTYNSGIGNNKEDHWMSTGCPTEVALQVFAHKLGMGRPSLVAPESSASPSSDPSSEPKADSEKRPLDVLDEDVDDEKQHWNDAFFPSSHSSSVSVARQNIPSTLL